MPPPSLPVTLYRGGSRQIGPRQIGPLENLAANWAPANRALFGAQFAIFWQIGPRQIGPLGGKLGPGKSGPGKSGPGKLGPWKMLVRQIGPLENWDPKVTNTVIRIN